ncbi:MAG: hypothetical protein ACK5HR_05290 [Mycoplasmatales bacterium]
MRSNILLLWYNLINIVVGFIIIVSLIILFSYTFLGYSFIHLSKYNFKEPQNFIFFIAILGIISYINRLLLINKIHRELDKNYESNNMTKCPKKSKTKLREDEKNFFINIYNANLYKKFVPRYEGSFNDLEITYSIESFNYNWSREYEDNQGKKRKETIFKFNGIALNIEYENFYFGSLPLVYFNDSLLRQSAEVQLELAKIIPINLKNFKGYFAFNEIEQERLEELVRKIYPFINKLANHYKVMIIFRSNRITILQEDSFNLKVKLPFLITPYMLYTINNNQKKSVYSFNITLNELATIFY